MPLSKNTSYVRGPLDAGDGSLAQSQSQFVETTEANIDTLYTAAQNILSVLGANDTGSDTTLANFSGVTLPNGTTVTAALQTLETYVESLNVLEPGYVQNATVAFPAPGDSLELAISKLHRVVTYLQGLDALRFAGTFDASVGTFPSAGTDVGGTVSRGDVYRVTVAGVVSGEQFNVGDQLIALVDAPSTSVFASNWVIIDNTDLVTSFNSRTGAILPTTGDYTAAQITNTPAGNIAATNVQAALNELDTEKVATSFITAKGSLVSGTALATPIGVAVGTDGTALMADSTTSSGLSYGVQLESRVDQANLTANTTLAASVVNNSNYIAFAQTTSGITVTLPNPTVGGLKHRTITLCNEGTAELGVAFVSGQGFFLIPNNVMDITWNGTRWVAANAQLAVISEQAQAVIAAGSTVPATNGFFVLSSVTGNLPISGSIIPVQAGSTYRFEASLTRSNFTSAGELTYQFRDITTGTDLGSPGSLTSNYTSGAGWGGIAKATFTPTANSSVQLVVKKNVNATTLDSNNGTNAGTVFVEKIAGNAPVLGTTVETVEARITGQSITQNAPIQFNNVVGNIPYNATANQNFTGAAGTFLLRAGKTYRLEAGVVGYTVSRATFGWQNLTGGTTNLGTQMGLMAPSDSAGNAEGGGIASATFSPTVDSVVQFTLLNASPGTLSPGDLTGGNNAAGWANITQVGTTAFSGSITPNVVRFTTSGTYTPTVGMKYCEVEAVGGGGGGGPSQPTFSSQVSVGAGGGAGAYVKARYTAAQIGASRVVTIGAPGGPNGAGGDTRLGTVGVPLLIAGGGGGGGGGGAAAVSGASGGQGGTTNVPVGTVIVERQGEQGGSSVGIASGTSTMALQGGGGNTPFGRGGASFAQGSSGPQSGTGGTPTAANTGAGGGAAISAQGGAAATGGSGSGGVMVITEYFL